tara:strand:+ start:1919 stop:2296 length:378 start_codon:yes stop_codon:yes gene_type:complete
MSKSDKLLKAIHDSEDIFEMATFRPDDIGIPVNVKLNILQPGDKKLQHGPRIKVMHISDKEKFSIILSSDDEEIEVVKGHKSFLKKKDEKILLEFIKKYKNAFLKFWFDPNMSVGELKDEMSKYE